MIKYIGVLLTGYLLSWIIHGKLFIRLGHFYGFMKDKDCYYTVRRAWRLSGKVI
jgi:hypothetical protein